MLPARKILAVGFAVFTISIATPVAAQSIDLLRYGAGLGPYESDGYDDETAAPPPQIQHRAAPQKATHARKGAACSQQRWDALEGWVNVVTPCR
jgi:hypothetical protein